MFLRKKKSPWMIVPFVFLIISAVFLVMLFLVKLLWQWTIPDLFPGAVSQGLVSSSISWFTAFKVSIFVMFFAALAGVRRR